MTRGQRLSPWYDMTPAWETTPPRILAPPCVGQPVRDVCMPVAGDDIRVHRVVRRRAAREGWYPNWDGMGPPLDWIWIPNGKAMPKDLPEGRQIWREYKVGVDYYYVRLR